MHGRGSGRILNQGDWQGGEDLIDLWLVRMCVNQILYGANRPSLKCLYALRGAHCKLDTNNQHSNKESCLTVNVFYLFCKLQSLHGLKMLSGAPAYGS